MSRLRFPIIKDVRLDAVGLPSTQTVFPADLPNIHQGETISVFGRFDRPEQVHDALQRPVGGQGRRVHLHPPIERSRPRRRGRLPPDWAFWKLHDLYSLIIREGERPEAARAGRRLKEKVWA